MLMTPNYNYTPNLLPRSDASGTKESNRAKYNVMFPTPKTPPKTNTLNKQTQPSTSTTVQTQSSSKSVSQRPKNVISDAEKEFQKRYMKELDNLYGEGINILNAQQKRLQEFQPQYQSQLAQTFESQIPELQRVAEAGKTKIGEQETDVQKQRESALSTARRQYSEGLQKGQQIFGGVGGSSTGQAFSDIASQELLRNTGQIMTASSQNLQSLQNARREIDMKIQSDLAKLDLDKKTSLLKAQDDFRQQLDAIDSKKYELKTQKANAQLQALKDFNTRRQTLEDFYLKQQAEIETYRQKLSMGTSTSASQINAIGEGINLADITDPISYTSTFNYLVNNPTLANTYGYLVETDNLTGEPRLIQASPIYGTTGTVNPYTGELETKVTQPGRVFTLNR